MRRFLLVLFAADSWAAHLRQDIQSDETALNFEDPLTDVSKFMQDREGGARPHCREIFLESLMGRTGNSLMQFVNGLGIAEKLGATKFTITNETTRGGHMRQMRTLFDFPQGDITFHVKPNPEARQAWQADVFAPDAVHGKFRCLF